MADTGNGTVQQISPASVALRIAGSQSASCGTGASVDGPALNVCLDANSVAPVPDGSIYIADDTSIRRLVSGNITTIAGISGPGSIGYVDGTGSAVRFAGIRDIVVDPSGNLLIVDKTNRRIRKMNSTGAVTTLAGSGVAASTDGTGVLAAFVDPNGITVDATGTAFVTDGNKIRKVTPAGVVTTFAGTGVFGVVDGPAATAAFSGPTGLVFDAAGNLYVGGEESTGTRLRVVSPTGEVSTLTGSPGGDPGNAKVGVAIVSGVLYTTWGFRVLKYVPYTLPALSQSSLYGVSSSFPGERKPVANPPLASDPVNTSTGGFELVAEDLVVPGRGPGLVVRRSYDSKQSYSSYFGDRWGHSYDSDAQGSAGILSWRTESGSSIDLVIDGSAPVGFVATAKSVPGGGYSINRIGGLVDRFNAAGRLISRLDRSGQGVTVAYNGSGRLSVATDSAGRTITFTYGTTGAATNRIVSIAASDGRTVTYGHTFVNGLQRLTSVTDPRGKVTTYEYDAGGRLAKEIDPNLKTKFINVYDSSSRVIDQTDPLGNHSTFVYDDVAQTTKMTDAAGAVFTYKRPGFRAEGMTGPTGSATPSLSNSMDITSFTDQTGATWSATYDAAGNMLTRTAPAPLSYVESWTYDAKNNPLTYVDAKGITTTYTYDTTGRLLTTSRPAPVGNAVTTNVWNANGTLLSSTDPRGATTTFAYDLNGNMLSSTDALGNKTSYTYDTAGRVLTMVEPRGNVSGGTPSLYTTTYTYDANGNVLTTKDALNRTTTRAYDNAGNLSSITAPDTGLTTFAYNAANELLSQTPPDGGITSYEYSNRGQRTKQTDPTGGITTWTYDAAGRMVTMVEPRGNVSGATASLFTTTYIYDAVGRQTSITDPAGRVTTTVYDVLGRVATRTDPQGTTTFAYDGNGNVLSTARTGIGTSSSTYDSLNRVATAIDPRGKTTTYTYDLGGNLTLLTSPLGFKTSYTYDPVGRKVTMVDPRGNVSGGVPANFTTTYEYDAAGNQIGVTNQLGQKTISTYTQTGTVASVKDPKLNTTTFAYDPMDRVNGVTAPASGTTSYAYNTAGRLTSRTDSKTRVTGYVYDLSGRLTKQTDPLGRFKTFFYDPAGNQTKMVNARANAAANPLLGSTTVTFDTSGRPTLTDYSDTTPDVGLAYDSIGRVSSMTDGAGTETYGYDSAGRLTTVTRGTATYTYAYDNNGNVTSRTYPDGTVTTYAYDDDNRLSTVTTATKVTIYTYDAAGNVTATALPNGVSRTVAYDQAGRVSTLNSTLGATPIAGYTFVRDANGFPSTITATGTNVAGVRQFTYDGANRLTSVCYVAGACPAASNTIWTYDTVGNRSTEKIGSAAVTTYTYDNADQLISAVIGGVTTSYGYDADGNQTNAGTRISTFNTAAQTTSIKDGAATPTTYAYDGRGKRLSSTNGAVVTKFSWDQNSSLPMLATETDGAGTLLRRYTYGLEPVSVSTPTATSYYVTDELGSATHVTSATGATQWAYTYTPFGTTKTGVKVDPLVTNNPLKYTGQYEDPTGNYNLRARLYNPALGAFSQTDPAPLGAGSAFESAYAYAFDNPALFVDPSGLRGQKKCNTSVGRQVLGALKAFSPVNGLSLCDAAAIQRSLNPLQVAGTVAAGASCGLISSPIAVLNPVQGPQYVGGLATACGAAASLAMTNVRNGTSGGYAEAIAEGAVQGFLTTPPGVPRPAPAPTPLPNEMTSTFSGGRYSSRVLSEDTVLYRAGTADQPLGQFFSAERPVGMLQTRIDRAIPLRWPNGQAAPLDTGFAIRIPAGTTVYEGIIANQGGVFMGGTGQIVIPKPWTIPGVQVVSSWGLK